MNIGKNLKSIRLSRNLTLEQLANDLTDEYPEGINFNKGKLSKWENNKEEPMLSSLKYLADYYGITVDELVSGNDKSITTIYNQLEQPRQQKVYDFAEYQLEEQNNPEVYGATAAGAPIENQQVPTIYSNQTDVSLLVSGDSMESLYHDGDVITYRKQQSLENGEIGVFVLNNGITMKKFKRTENEILLRSLNDKYEDIIVTEKDDFAILGKVIK